jgi:hypothetical protein
LRGGHGLTRFNLLTIVREQPTITATCASLIPLQYSCFASLRFSMANRLGISPSPRAEGPSSQLPGAMTV